MAPRDLRARLGRRASRANLFLSDDLASRLIAYYELLDRWNRKINLTSIDNPDEAIDRLLLEPVAAARHLPPGAVRLMDVGSGGGSPAIPIKLTVPSIDLTMVEVKARKSAFLREAIRQLQLEGARVETARYEELLARPELHEAFSVVTLRAVRVEARSLVTLQAFVAPGGVMLLFRGVTGPDALTVIVPPLEFAGTVPLIDPVRSRLSILRKRVVGHVPRGTAG